MNIFKRLIQNAALKALGERNSSWDILNPALYPFMGQGMSLFKDGSKLNYINDGYESSPVVFSVIMKLATLFTSIEVKPFKGEKESDYDPLREYFTRSTSDMNFSEHRLRWALQNYTLGEALITHDYLPAGNNKGNLMTFQIMPAQHTDIEPLSKIEPVGFYVVKLSGVELKITPDKVWHNRLFPEQDYQGGKNFRGLSPIKVAANRIEAMNNGALITANTYKRGMPPGVLGHETVNEANVKGTQERLEKLWREKYGNTDRAGMPIFMSGKLYWIPLGFSNFRDLMIIENSQDGLREFCNVFGVSARLFNDPRTSNYDSSSQEAKDLWEGRIIPDHKQYIEGLNNIFEPRFGITYKGLYDNISALDDDNTQLYQWASFALQNKAISRNEFRELMSQRFRSVQLERLELEGMDLTEESFLTALTPFNMINENEEPQKRLMY